MMLVDERRAHALSALFVLYFAAFGAMLSGMSTRGLQLLSLAVLCVSTAALWRRARITRSVIAMLVIVTAQAIALFMSPSSPEGVSQVVLLMAVLVIAWLSSTADARTLEAAIFATLAAVALITLYQALNHWVRVDPFSLPPRLGSTFWNPNNLAFAMLLGAALAFRQQRWFWLLVFVTALVLTGSLTSLAAGAIGLAVYLLLLGTRSFRLRRQVLVAAPVVLALGAVVVFQVLRRPARNVELGSFGQRIRLWQVAVEMFTSRPLFGLGPGSFKEFFYRAGLLEPGPSHHHAHNIYLHAAAESGLLGLLALAVVFVLAVMAIRAAWRDGLHKSAALGASLLVMIALHGLFDYVFWIPSMVLLTLWTGQVVLSEREAHEPAHRFSREWLRTNARVAQVVVLGMALFRYTSEQDFLGSSLAQYTTALGLLLAVLLLIALPPGLTLPVKWPSVKLPRRILPGDEAPPGGETHIQPSPK